MKISSGCTNVERLNNVFEIWIKIMKSKYVYYLFEFEFVGKRDQESFTEQDLFSWPWQSVWINQCKIGEEKN